ncbi:MAG: 7TM diverse intracellular signaling domain-containing protein [Spirochaetota bacterium]
MKLFLLVFLAFPIFSRPVVLEESFQSLTIGKYLEYYEDKEGKLSIEDVTSPEFQTKFQKSKQHKPGFGITASAYWVKFAISSRLRKKKQLILEHSYPLVDEVDFYYQDLEQNWQKKLSGDTRSFAERDLKDRNFLFEIGKEPETISVYYLKIRTIGTLQVPLRLYTKNKFIESLQDEGIILGIYYGIMSVMFIYNLLLFLSLKDSLYLYYCFYLLCSIFTFLFLNGIGFQYIWTDFPWFNNRFVFFQIAMAIISTTIFSVKFLDLKSYFPRFKTMLIVSCVLIFILGVLSFFDYFYSKIVSIMLPSVILNNMVLFLISVLVAMKGYKPARFYIVAFFTLLIGTILLALSALSFLPSNFFTENTVQIGSALESILLSLAVADKIIFMRREREDTKSRLIESQAEAIENQKILVRSYARFIPFELLRFLGKDSITEVHLGDSVEKDMTVLFSDIRSFTSISEGMTAEESFAFINSYLEMIAPSIRKYNGYIDKFLGDGIMALFPGEPQDAIDAAIEMLENLHLLNLKRLQKSRKRISVGIGIHTGKQVVGVIGEKERLEGTVISDAVNTAARLEGLTKAYGAALVVSEETLNGIENSQKYKIRYLDTVKVKGKNQSVRILEVLEGMSERIIHVKSKTKAEFSKGIQYYQEKRFDLAEKSFREVLRVDPKDKAAELYHNRCAFYAKHGVEQGWSGIEDLDFK